MEVGRPGPSYTVDSVEELRRTYDDAALFLIMSADSLAQIDDLARAGPAALPGRMGWSVRGRARHLRTPSSCASASVPQPTRIHLLDGPSLDVSATEIRARVAAGRPIRYLVPRAVEELIVERGLYRRTRQRGEALGADSSTE